MPDFIKGLREVIQDLLVPELKAVQVERSEERHKEVMKSV